MIKDHTHGDCLQNIALHTLFITLESIAKIHSYYSNHSISDAEAINEEETDLRSIFMTVGLLDEKIGDREPQQDDNNKDHDVDQRLARAVAF